MHITYLNREIYDLYQIDVFQGFSYLFVVCLFCGVLFWFTPSSAQKSLMSCSGDHMG